MNQIMMNYRTCFSTQAGKAVLTDLLMESGYFDTDLDEGDIGVENFAKMILHKMGIYDAKDLNQQARFVDNLFKLPVDYGKEANNA